MLPNKPLKIPFYLVKGGKPEFITPFTSDVEKSILEYSVMVEDTNLIFENVCELLGVPEYLPLDLKFAWIYKVREVSFGSDLKLRYKCSHCKRVTESVLLLENLIDWKDDNHFPDRFKNLRLRKDVTLDEILAIRPSTVYSVIDNPSHRHQHIHFSDKERFDEMMASFLYVETKKPMVKPTLECNCLMCGAKRKVNILNKKFCLDTLSEHTPTSMLQTYNILAQNGFGKLDVDSMLPFEREIHMTFIEKRAKEIDEKTARMLK